jgi:hypothetical protein
MVNTWLEIEDLPDNPRYVPVERLQEAEMQRLLGWELNLWLQLFPEKVQHL